MLFSPLRTSVAVIFAASFFGASHAASPFPSKMVFFVTSDSCPTGSAPASDAAGRMLLVTTNVGDVGRTYGVPLKDQEDRTHAHSGSMTVDLPSHHISGATGCCNGQATSKGKRTADITSGAGTTGLPFVQYRVCEAK